MKSNTKLYKFMFYKPFSEKKQHLYAYWVYGAITSLQNETVYHIQQRTLLYND